MNKKFKLIFNPKQMENDSLIQVEGWERRTIEGTGYTESCIRNIKPEGWELCRGSNDTIYAIRQI